MFPGLPDDENDSRSTAERLSDFRSTIDSRSNFDYEERRNDISRSKNVFIGAVSGVVLAAIVGWFVLSPRYVQNSSGEIPVIRRPQSAIKVQPAEPGGMEILNQDKTIYDIIDKKGDSDVPGAEKLLPPPEEPQIPVISAPEIGVKTTIQTPEVTEVSKVDVKPAVETKEDTKAAPQDQMLISQAQEIIKAETAKQAPADTTEKVAAMPKPEINLPEAPQSSDKISAGSWTVQLMSSPNQNAVRNSWASLSRKHMFLKGLPYEVESADLGTKGIYYRLYTGSFNSRDGADDICQKLKAAGGTCIVKKK